MATINIDAVVALLGRELTPAESQRAVTLLDLAEGVVEDALPGFSMAEDTETVEFWSVDSSSVWTPRYPVRSIGSLTVNDAVQDASSYHVTSKGHIEWLRTWCRNWPTTRLRVTAEYSFGLNPPPYSLVKEIAGAVAATIRRQATNSDGLMAKSESIDGYSYTDSYGTAEQAAIAAGLIVDTEAIAVRRWKRNRQVSVPLTS